jgi:hypothetical protein
VTVWLRGLLAPFLEVRGISYDVVVALDVDRVNKLHVRQSLRALTRWL